jgi:menaquinone-dependent protoporphyrinogen oxidase
MTAVLVAYASGRGATVEIAEAIADRLRERHLAVDCRPPRSGENLFGYDVVVIGSAVYFNRWRPEAMRFLRRHASRLAGMPLRTFSSGRRVPLRPGSSSLIESASWLRLCARGHDVFGGGVWPCGHDLLRRALVTPIPRPYRESARLGGIRACAATIADELAREQAPPRGEPSVV